jgi:rubrerythrin
MGKFGKAVHEKGSRVAVEKVETAAEATDDFVEFWTAGDPGKGEFRCSECAYGITVYRALPVCPMCSGGSWEQAAWSPFSRALRLQ